MYITINKNISPYIILHRQNIVSNCLYKKNGNISLHSKLLLIIMEKLYMPSHWCYRRCSPEMAVAKHIEFVTKESLLGKKDMICTKNIRYGLKPNQIMDVYEPNNALNSPTFIYIHGGYWQELNKDISSYCVKPLIQSKIRVVIAGYDLCPNESLQTIITEIRELVITVHQMAVLKHWGKIWIGGHSAGAHLAACILCSDQSKYISGFILMSGIYDLQPLTKTSINNALNLTKNEAKLLSPIFHLPNKNKEFYSGLVFAVVAEFDSPAFHDQQYRFLKKLRKFGVTTNEMIIPNTDHFTLVENLCCNNYVLTTLIVDYILK